MDHLGVGPLKRLPLDSPGSSRYLLLEWLLLTSFRANNKGGTAGTIALVPFGDGSFIFLWEEF